MRRTDIAIIGGGLAGATAAAMLGKAGVDVILIDPHTAYPPDFRCEKLDGDQIRILKQTGLAEAVMRVATHDRESWVARMGYVVEKRPGDQYGIMYDDLVNTIRGEISESVSRITSKAVGLELTEDRQVVTLSAGDPISARLVVLANGLNPGLRQKLGLNRRTLSQNHSVSIGFDIYPAAGQSFSFRALTFYCDRPSERAAFLTLFPIGSVMRANFFSYRDPHDPWFQELRTSPVKTLNRLMPRLEAIIGPYEIPDFIKVRPVDLQETETPELNGLVLVGDAYSTSCPAAGTGARKALVDVERLCSVYVGEWLSSPGMSANKVSRFYADSVKRASDASSLQKAFAVRSFSTDRTLKWTAHRWGKFLLQAGRGALRTSRGAATAPVGDRTVIETKLLAG